MLSKDRECLPWFHIRSEGNLRLYTDLLKQGKVLARERMGGIWSGHRECRHTEKQAILVKNIRKGSVTSYNFLSPVKLNLPIHESLVILQ